MPKIGRIYPGRDAYRRISRWSRANPMTQSQRSLPRLARSAAGSAARRFVPAAAAYLGGPLAGLAAQGVMSAASYFGRRQQTRSKPARYGNGRWTGYVKRKRINRRKAARTQRKLNTSYMLSVEKSGTQTPSVAGVLGHSSISRTYAVRALFGALLRMVFYRAGMKADSPTQNISNLSTGTVVGCEFQYAGGTNDGFSVTITAPNTFTGILDAFVNSFNTKYDSLSATLVPYDVRFRNIYLQGNTVTLGTPQTISIDLVNAKVSMWCSSRLKIQNRSVNTAGDDDANDVDNVPINCVNYSGYGTGLDSRYDFLGLGFCANQDCIIATSDPALAGDAPLPALLNGVKKTGFMRINPGNIKTDVVKHKIYMSLDTITRHILGPRGNGNLRLPIGKFSFIHYEKTLEANNATPVAMSIAYENQLYINSKIILNSGDLPIPEFVRS